ncbi:MAG TPA: hypothetical protein P5531_01305 [Bacteroidales bacterium]|nr:hypothetical protein [Bacteroidales bacterium]HSA42291.1 hypothetical protein [Bacteroidales bacterium]
MKQYRYFSYLFLLLAAVLSGFSCSKHSDIIPENTSNEIKIDSIIPSARDLLVWQQCSITVYARGNDLEYNWKTDHGSMVGLDSVTVIYWGCPSCIGTNTVKCTVSNSTGSVSDTIMLHVRKQ